MESAERACVIALTICACVSRACVCVACAFVCAFVCARVVVRVNGDAATRQLRESGYTAAVVGVTGDVTQSDVQSFVEVRASRTAGEPSATVVGAGARAGGRHARAGQAHHARPAARGAQRTRVLWRRRNGGADSCLLRPYVDVHTPAHDRSPVQRLGGLMRPGPNPSARDALNTCN